MSALALCLAVLSAASPSEGPVSPAVQQAVETRLARLAVEMVPGSLERAPGPDSSPYRFFTYQDARAAQRRGVAVSDAGEVAVAGDPESLGRFFAGSKFFARHGPADALEVWRLLAQAAPLLDLAAIQALPEDEKKAVYPVRREEREGGVRVTGFVRQGEEIFRVQLEAMPGRAEVQLKALGELLGRDEIDEAARALHSADEIVRAAAAFELAEKKAPRAFEALVAALEDRSSNVRATVADSLLRQVKLDESRKAAAHAALQKALAREEDPAAKEALTQAVAASAPPAPEKKAPAQQAPSAGSGGPQRPSKQNKGK
ncbi:MAG TPA: HEAT repeat domain-containing protein [Myxococcales bacterium]|jgi:hypothetical protein